MKKILTGILCLAMLLTAMIPAVFAETGENSSEQKYSAQISFAVNLGIMDFVSGNDFAGDKVLTRADFAEIICKLLQLETGGMENSSVSFEDVTDSIPQKTAILAVAQYGYMNGIGGGQFAPERELTLEETVKTLLHFMGYDAYARAKGGYPSGWLLTAHELGVLKGISGSGSLSRAELAAMFYNMRNVGLMQGSEFYQEGVKYSANRSITFMTEILRVEELRGIMSDNGCTTLTGDSEVGENRIKVGETVLNTDDKTAYAMDFIGREVRVYYRSDEAASDYQNLVYAEKTENDFAITFSFQDFEGFREKEIFYAKNDRQKSVRLADAPYVIFNGKAEKSLKSEYLDGYEYGTVTLARSSGSQTFNLVIIEAYISAFVSDVDFEAEKIYLSKDGPDIRDGEYQIENSADNFIRVFHENGDKIPFTDITPFSVIDISRNGDICKIILPRNNYLQDILVKVISDNKITCESGEYEISKAYMESDKAAVKPVLGEKYNVYINSFGHIVRFERSIGDPGYSVGYLIKSAVREEALDQKTVLKLLTDTGSVIIYDAAEKLRFKDSAGITQSVKTSKLNELLNGYCGLVQYSVNENMKISYLGLPAAKGEFADDGASLNMIFDSTGSAVQYRGNVLGGYAILDNNTRIFKVNENIIGLEDEEDIYSVITKNELASAEGKYKAAVYTYEKNSPLARYAVIYDDETAVYKSDTLYFVEEVTTTIDDAGEEAKGLHCYAITRSADMKSQDFVVKNSVTENVSDATGGSQRYSIQNGDVVRIHLENNKVKKIQLVFRTEADNILNPNGAKGVLAGTIGYFDSAVSSSLTNPIKGTEYYAADRFLYGSVLSTDDAGNMVYTTQDLSDGTYDKNDARFVTEAMPFQAYFTVVDRKSNGDYIVSVGELNDIRAYNDVGNSCSRILMMMSYGSPRAIIIFNS